MTGMTSKLKRLALSFAAAVGMFATVSGYAADTANLDIPPGELASALKSLARQTGLELIFQPGELKGLKTQGVKGNLSPQDAVAKLIGGTKLFVTTDSAGAILISSKDPAVKPVSSGADAADTGSALKLAEADSPQNPQPSGSIAPENQTEVIVTGSRIRGARGSASKVYSIDREDIEATGLNSVSALLNTLPQNFTGGNTESGAALSTGRNGSDGNVGFGSGLNLRGLGSESTLVLLNGRRVAAGGTGGFVDVSLLPLSAVERIEVMPDGASAIYGSDAVGGVVNFILRKDFSGAETGLYYAEVGSGGMSELSANQLLGAHWNGGSVLFNVDYRDRDPLLASERSYATGLQTGVTYLTPSEERLGFLASGHQQFGERWDFGFDLFYNDRTASSRNYSPSVGAQYGADGDTGQLGGTLSLGWALSESWSLEAAYSQSRTETDRLNYLGLSNRVIADVRNSIGEIEAQGALFSMPGGKARLAVGAERRSDSYTSTRVNSGGAGGTRERDINAAYAELLLPFVGADNRAAWAHRLDLTLAARHEDYSDVGSADTMKLGAVWSPVEGFNLRTTFGTSFRAPYVSQFDSPVGTGVLINISTSPTTSTRVAMILNTADPNLGPEEAKTWSAGFDIDADRLGGVRVSANYFNIDYEDRIGAARAAFSSVLFTDPTLSLLMSQPADPAILAQIPTLRTFVNLTTGPLSSAQATWDGRVRNQAHTQVSGVDFTADKTFGTHLGDFTAGVNASYFLEFENQLVAGAPVVDILNAIFNPMDLRVRGQLGWRREAWAASAFVNHAASYKDNQVPAAVVGVDSWTTVDLGVSYSFQHGSGWLQGLTVSANAINAFDEDPPRVVDSSGGYGSPGYDSENANPLGRVMSLKILKRW